MTRSLPLFALLGLLCGFSEAGHSDMFSCRSKNCPVVELTDDNWDAKVSADPHFVMFYAPWCGHCKQLAPKLKKAAKMLADVGVKVGSVDVEPNRNVQAKYPDIKGFPTLKFVPSKNPKKSVDFNGGRDEDSIVEFSKQQAKIAGVTLGESVPVKTNAEMYTFLGRSALEGKPAMILVGGSQDEAAPGWVGKLAADLRKLEPKVGAESPEMRTRELITEAASVTKNREVKESLKDLLKVLDAAEAKGATGPPVVTPGFTNDDATATAFGLEKQQRPALVLASVDRKTGGGSYVVYGGKLGKKVDLKPLAAFVREHLPHCDSPHALRTYASADAASFTEFPKPASVLAAEERAAKKRAEAGSISEVADAGSLTSKCYDLSGRTCTLLLLSGGATAADTAVSALAQKYSRDGFSFAVVDVANEAGAAYAAQLIGEGSEFPAMVVVKTGKRPRVASANGGAQEFENLLDTVVGGGAQFSKLKGGLPDWPEDGEEDGADEL